VQPSADVDGGAEGEHQDDRDQSDYDGNVAGLVGTEPG
jgi:hypothetical protein